MTVTSAIHGITRILPKTDGIFYAIDPSDAHNWLDGGDYDANHVVDLTASHHLADVYINFSPKKEDVSVLEVGCGSGNLTIGLNAHKGVSTLVACDISKKMLSTTRDRLALFEGGHTALVCANISEQALFTEGGFDAVFGNSLLHHIYNYEDFLLSLKHTVKCGGVIVFSEPCQQGKSLISFLCATLVQLDAKMDNSIFDDHDRQMIQALLDINRRELEVRHDQSLKLEWEDKHCFDTKQLTDVANDIGFSNFAHFNTQPVIDGLQHEVVSHLKLVGVNRSLDRFSELFDAFQNEYVVMCEEYIQTPHQFLAFTK